MAFRVFIVFSDLLSHIYFEHLGATSAKYEKGRRFKSYISRAGGFDLTARGGKSYIIYPNGDARRTHNILGIKIRPKVKPGSEIIVPGGRRIVQWDITKVVGLTTSLLTTYIFIENFVSTRTNN